MDYLVVMEGMMRVFHLTTANSNASTRASSWTIKYCKKCDYFSLLRVSLQRL
jgi:hypothetical protein